MNRHFFFYSVLVIIVAFLSWSTFKKKPTSDYEARMARYESQIDSLSSVSDSLKSVSDSVAVEYVKVKDTIVVVRNKVVIMEKAYVQRSTNLSFVDSVVYCSVRGADFCGELFSKLSDTTTIRNGGGD